MIYFYSIALLVSILMLIYVSLYNFKNIEIYYWTISIVITLINMGYYFRATSASLDAALNANRLVQLESTLLPLLAILSIFKNYRIKIASWIKGLLYGLCLLLWWVIGYGQRDGQYYSTVGMKITKGGLMLLTTPGPLKGVINFYVLLCLSAILLLSVYGYFNRLKYSIRTTLCYLGVAFFAMIVYTIQLHRLYDIDFNIIVYALGDLFIVLSYDRRACYDVDAVISYNTSEETERGYIVLDRKKRFLCANSLAVEYMPEISRLVIDKPIPHDNGVLDGTINRWVENYENGLFEPNYFKSGDNTFRCVVSKFRINQSKAPKGYLIEMANDTIQQRYVELMKSYNETLNDEVRKQTEHIARMQNKVVLGLADMVENRDNNTGGHVKRTSDVVRIIVDAIKDTEAYEMDENFADDIVRAAPMHDLGKIAIDNAILNKRGRLTDEEFKLMKVHSQKSSEIVHGILKDVEEPHFVTTAYNLARHHHERWDGKGYPDGLAGDKIPLEARIMAIADVYDALVSKRCYKEAFSFEEAGKIMLENMGSQFDPSMKAVFTNCREKLENYYSVNV